MAQKRSLTRSLTRKQKIGGKNRTAVKKGGVKKITTNHIKDALTQY